MRRPRYRGRYYVPAEPVAAMTASSGRAPRLVRTVVCGYSRDELPVAWLQVFRRFEASLARARLRVRVRLVPLEELPEAFEVLIVPEHLRERAVAAAPDARLIVTAREAAHAAA
ncbi:MAG: hypothetical protein ACRDM0_03895, partial [Thermoleophilaceae bacterium]